MAKRTAGLVLLVLFAVASAAAALYSHFHFDNLIAQERAGADAFARTVHTAQLALADLRGAQAAYFAAGQGPDFWPKRASETAAALERSISELQAGATSPAAKAHYESAVSALGGLNSLDQKARDDMDIGESRLAADVIFGDATASAETLATALAAGRAEELIAREARVSDLRRQNFQYASAGVAGVLIAALMLGMVGRRPRAEGAEPVTSIVERVVPAPAPVVEERAPGKVEEPLPITLVEAAPRVLSAVEGRVDLSSAAQVCVDLGRVLDGQDIPPLLERAARVLDAKGLVLWVADGSGAMLRASLAHGYPEKILKRLGPLQVDADNVTSLAFRSMQVQTLADAKGSASAFAVPLITSTGCIGVLAAEMAHGRASSETVPVARMFAAQLATLVTPDAVSAGKSAIG
jgi:hypothetical protein